MRAFVVMLLLVAPLSASAAKKKPKQPQNVIDMIPELQPQKPRGEDGQPLPPPEPDPPPENAPYKGCVDARGIAVLWREAPQIADLAQALFDKRSRPTIEYNPARFKFMSEMTRTFFFAHECAHHALGHLYGGVQGVDKEQQADCWAVLMMKEAGTLGDEGLQQIQQELGTIARSDPNHSAGLRRAANLKWCMTEPIPKAPEKFR